MANLETQIVDDILVKSRRKMLALGGTALAGLMVGGTKSADAQSASYADTDILNFALNLEYLEANFYYLAAFGTTIDKPNAASIKAGGPSAGYALKGLASGSNPTAGGTVTVKPTGVASCLVPFGTTTTGVLVGGYATETAIEEGKHVGFLYNALGAAAVAQAPLDLYNSFVALGNLVGVSNFDPFSSPVYFLAGAYIFEDVGVSAYHGAASLFTQTTTGKSYLQAAAGILAVEAYHAGLVRTTINAVDPTNAMGLLSLTTSISNVRAGAALPGYPANTTGEDGGGTSALPDDYGLTNTSVVLGTKAAVPATNIVNADPKTAVAFARTVQQVLNIVTVGGAYSGSVAVTTGAKGGFFPTGLNGLFR